MDRFGSPLSLIAMVAAVLPFATAHAQDDAKGDGPSFDCARVTSDVNRLICATPELAAWDRKLAIDYAATLHQGGTDQKALAADEDRWLRTIRNRCPDAACLETAYASRDRAVLDQGLKAASPAAYDETRPFPTPSASLEIARAWIGKPCGRAPATPFPDFTRIKGYLPVVTPGAIVAPFETDGTRFAFLLLAGNDPNTCRVADVVALPDADAGMSFLQCTLGGEGDDHGFGVRRDGHPNTAAYWTIDIRNGRLMRRPLGVLSGFKLVCREPETGE
ncbi:MAG TPA: hypothetical protein VGV37_00310 [Aliidongia sp.]|uniref:lysozyme inhibitor LprI family protein n=1 Tax=Aliidongia sp. TaxID=1914230 RepID=UPI002DDD59F2|nr:hypothetical protein [Aliidongia sp.]HEV2672949.1 hypothetical protein [Aliidongia sp.]